MTTNNTEIKKDHEQTQTEAASVAIVLYVAYHAKLTLDTMPSGDVWA